MASGKKVRKQARLDRKATVPNNNSVRHPDGDRRRRDGPSAKDAIRIKKLLQEIPWAIVADDDGGEAG